MPTKHPTHPFAAPAGPAGTARPATVVTSVGSTSSSNGGTQTPTITDIVRQRILTTVDPLASTTLTGQIQARTNAVANLYLGMQQVQQSLQQLSTILAGASTPGQLIGVIAQPDGTPAKQLQVQFNPASLNSAKPPITIQTGDDGSFHLPLPQGLPLPSTGLPLVVHGANGNLTLTIAAAQIGANGLVNTIVLPQTLQPLPVSVLAALQALVPTLTAAAPQQTTSTANAELPIVKVGEDNGCMMSFAANQQQDRFPYGVFYRLVEPRASIVAEVDPAPVGGGKLFTILPKYLTSVADVAAASPASPTGNGTVSYVDRVPIEQPLSVDGFRDQLMGLLPNGTFTGDETLPMAGTLGLGYVLWLSQRWNFQGVGLGDLIYSLPLAPGEQQEVAVFERTDTATVTESEFFSEEQAQQQMALADTSTSATFNSAFNEAIQGNSSYTANSATFSAGTNLIFASGGAGGSVSSGSSSQSLQGQRNTAQEAAQQTHSSAQNQANARRSAVRTGMRMATASESESVTTKVITNHNHTRALTLQFWEVLRLYDVTTAIDGLTLTCLIPMQVVRFLPPGQTLTLSDPSLVATRNQVLTRYSNLVKHADVLAWALPRRFQYGLTLLTQFASDPTATVEAFGGAAEDVIKFSLSGTFMACEDVTISAVTRRNTRVGPVRLTNDAASPPADTLTTRDQLIAWLTLQRQAEVTTMTGALALPQTMNRGDIIGFEISRRFKTLSYTLASPQITALQSIQDLFGGSSAMEQAIQSALGQGAAATPRETVTLTPADLEKLGGPLLYDFSAGIEELDGSGGSTPIASGEKYANDSLFGTELPPQPYPVPALQVGPVLRYNEVLEIEKMAQYVLRNTLQYSRAIWSSLSADERAVLLEAYTIGVPPGGISDPSQMIPLLNCVENRVLGYYGNSMIMPFIIPAELAQAMKNNVGATNGQQTDYGQLQDALLAYQVAGFKPPHSTLALPTRGVLGEAVLGHCASAEKIDLTRFWNWQDSPSDTAPQIAPTSLPTTSASIAAGLTAPNSLTQLPSLINNVLTAPSPDTSLLAAMGKDASSQQDFSSSLTGAQQLASLITNAQNTSNQARQDALQASTQMQSQAMATAGNIIGGIYGGNPTAGSSAAAAVHGQSPSGSGGSGGSGGTQQQQQGKGGGPSGGTSGGTTSGGGTSGGGTSGGGTSGGGTSGGGATAAPGPPT